MKITYNVEHLPERKRIGKEKEETLALKAFLADKAKKNMVIEYDDAPAAKRSLDSLRNFRAANKLQPVFEIWRNGKSVCIIKTKKPAASTS